MLGSMVFWHPTAVLGDEPPLRAKTTAAALASARNAKLWLPLWVLEVDHKPALRMGLPEDVDAASADGLIYASAARVRRRLRALRVSRRVAAEALSIMRREVEDYVQFVRQEVLQVVIVDQYGQVVDRRSGFYTESFALEEARWLAEHHASQLERYAPHRLKGPVGPPGSRQST